METTDARTRVTAILAGLSVEAARAETPEDLLPLVYDELRGLARSYMRSERREHTLQPTALVHEAYLRLVDQSKVGWRGRTHFFAVGARVMRHILVDHARGRGRLKRGGDRRRVTLSDWRLAQGEAGLGPHELLDLNRALEKLARLDEREAHVVELRFFAGLTVAEVAEALGVSKRTVEDDWTHARAWLHRELSRAAGE